MIHRELTKPQKKQVKALIDRALIRDYTDGIKKVKDICDAFIEGTTDPKEFYHKLYSTMHKKDKEIGRRYDDLTGSRYFLCLAVLLREGVLTNEDIVDLDVELKLTIESINKTA